MAIAQPAPSDLLSNPDHSDLHRIIAADVTAAVKSIQVSTTQSIISAPADGTTAIQFNKADLTTNVVTIDTTNSRVGIGTTGPNAVLEVVGANALLLSTLTSDAATPTLAFGDGDTGFYENSDDSIALSTAGVLKFYLAGGIGLYRDNSFGLLYETPSATNPVLVPDTADLDTGIGTAGANILSLIAGGNNGLNINNGNVGIGTTGPLAKLHIDQATADAAIPVLSLDQADISDGFINFIGATAASAAGPISSWTTGNTIQGFVRVEINGVQRWIAHYSDPTS